MLNFQQSYFLKSIAKLEQLPADQGGEVAFAGRSNAGKSSVLNVLTQQKQLARVSKTPGRTQLINFFQVDEQARLVDLPGYGYAKVSRQMRQAWQYLLEAYLQTRQSLQGLIIIMDIRHPFKPFDEMLLTWSKVQTLPIHVLLNKSDKLSRNQAQQTLFQAKKQLADHPQSSVQCFSALQRTGLDELQQCMRQWLS